MDDEKEDRIVGIKENILKKMRESGKVTTFS